MKLTKIARPDGLTEKEFLRHLQQTGHLTKLQLKAAARMLDHMLLTSKKKRANCTKAVLEALERGEVVIGALDPQAQKNLPKLKDVKADASPKQKLLELRRAGSLSPVECKAAAQALDRNPEQGVAAALISAGCERLVEQLPPVEPDNGGDDADGGDPPAKEPEEGDQGADPETPDEAKKEEETPPPPPMTVASILAKNAADAIGALAVVKHAATLFSILLLEAQQKDRKTVKDAIMLKLEELGGYEKADLLRAYEGEDAAATQAAAEKKVIDSL